MEKRLISRNNGWLCDLAFVYCMGKNFLFRMFFGWRESNEKGCVFILSKRACANQRNLLKKIIQINQGWEGARAHFDVTKS